MQIKYKKDWRKQPIWQDVTDIQFRNDSGLHIVKTDKSGWILLSDCIIKDGNFNTKDNPVPSLDKIEKFLYDNPDMFYPSPYNYIEICFKGIKKILKNGVETDNEQPNYKKAFNTLMKYWDSLPDEEKQNIHERLNECNV